MKSPDILILGHMPLIGISYQSKDKDEEFRRRFSVASEMRKVMDASLDMGVRKFAASTHGFTPLAVNHLGVIKQIIAEGYDINVFPCIGIPIKIRGNPVNPFRRWSTYIVAGRSAHPEMEQRILDDPISNFRDGWKLKLPSSRPYGTRDFNDLAIDWQQVENDLESFVELPVSYMEPGSETDFLSSAERFDLIGELVDRIKERGFRGVVLGVHNAGITIPTLDREVKGFEGYVTPVNSLGVMMFPTKISAEMAVKNTRKKIFAIKPMAGGRIKPEQAFKYTFSYDIEGCMIGAASRSEVEEDFSAAFKALK